MGRPPPLVERLKRIIYMVDGPSGSPRGHAVASRFQQQRQRPASARLPAPPPSERPERAARPFSARITRHPAWWDQDRGIAAVELEKKWQSQDTSAQQRFVATAATFKQHVEQFENRRQAGNDRTHAAEAQFNSKLVSEWKRKQESFQAWERRMEEEARRKKRERAAQQAAAADRFTGNRLARSHRLGQARQAAEERVAAVQAAKRAELAERRARNERKYLEAIASRSRVWAETQEWISQTEATNRRKREQVAAFIRKHNEEHPRATSRQGGPGGGLWVPTQGRAHSPRQEAPRSFGMLTGGATSKGRASAGLRRPSPATSPRPAGSASGSRGLAGRPLGPEEPGAGSGRCAVCEGKFSALPTPAAYLEAMVRLRKQLRYEAAVAGEPAAEHITRWCQRVGKESLGRICEGCVGFFPSLRVLRASSYRVTYLYSRITDLDSDVREAAAQALDEQARLAEEARARREREEERRREEKQREEEKARRKQGSSAATNKPQAGSPPSTSTSRKPLADANSWARGGSAGAGSVLLPDVA